MGFTVYEPAPNYPDEGRREHAVQVSGVLDATGDPELKAIVENARRSFGASMAAISILHGDWQYLVAAAGLPMGAYSRRNSFCGHAIMTPDQVFCVPDARVDARFAFNPVVERDELVRFYAGVPLVDGDGLPLGVLCVFDPKPRDACAAGEEGRLRLLAREIMERLNRLRAGDSRPDRMAAG